MGVCKGSGLKSAHRGTLSQRHQLPGLPRSRIIPVVNACGMQGGANSSGNCQKPPTWSPRELRFICRRLTLFLGRFVSFWSAGQPAWSRCEGQLDPRGQLDLRGLGTSPTSSVVGDRPLARAFGPLGCAGVYRSPTSLVGNQCPFNGKVCGRRECHRAGFSS